MNMVENPDKNYHLVLIHNDMKDMSAYEMISLLREFKSKFDLPILFISQTVTEKEIKELLKAGINDFEFNPKEQKKVIEMVVKFFNQKKLSFQS